MTKSAMCAKSSLLRSCAGAALAVASISLPHHAVAQGVQATPTVAQGNVTIDRELPGIDRVNVDGFDAVIDWDPDTISGSPLTFLPAGNVLQFRGAFGASGFAVLNRINPTLFPGPAEFAGLVQSLLLDANGGVVGPGGFVAFYSPTGILVSGTAVFETPQLLLTTNAVDLLSFTDFATGAGALSVSGFVGSGGVEIQPGAFIEGTPEDSFLIVSSDLITMDGVVEMNGSTAYVAAQDITIEHSSGLFDIVINRGTAGQAITHNGSTGGPESSGAGDNHIIYGVTASDPQVGPGVSMLFSGNLGFTPAGSATVADGEIILSANYNVNGRTIDGGTTGEGADSLFDGRTANPFQGTGDILLDDLSVTSNLTAVSTHQTILSANETSSSFAGDLVMVGREQAIIDAENGGAVQIGGELFVSANNFGSQFNSFPLPVTGGFAGIRSGPGGLVSVGGRSAVTAQGFAEVDFSGSFVGDATGGQAQVLAEGGTILLFADIDVLAEGRVQDVSGVYDFAGAFQGGTAQFIASEGGEIISDGGGLDIAAGGFSPNLTGANAGLPGTGTGGTVEIGTGANGGTINIINGFIFADASARTGNGFSSDNSGPDASGGSVTLSTSANSTFSVEGGVFLFADASAGNVAGGADAGNASGGTVTVEASSAMFIEGRLDLDTSAVGGSGDTVGSGGFGSGGVNSIVANGSTITITSLSQSFSQGIGGAATGTASGGDGVGGTVEAVAIQGGEIILTNDSMVMNVDAFGGDALSGAAGSALSGNADVIVDGNSRLDIALDLEVSGAATGGSSQSGAGGDGTSSNMSLLISVAGGSDLAVGGTLIQAGDGVGGDGFTGGTGTGGAVGFVIDGSSILTANALDISADGTGGNGDSGAGGLGEGGSAVALVDGLLIIEAASAISATGLGGATLSTAGAAGGTGTGGTIQLNAQGGTVDGPAATLILDASGTGGAGDGLDDSGGLGAGGQVAVEASDGGAIALFSLDSFADGIGGDTFGLLGGEGRGGQVDLISASDNPTIAISSDVLLSATGTGGSVQSFGGTGGAGNGGATSAVVQDGGEIAIVGALTAITDATGGLGQAGGEASAGTAAIGGNNGRLILDGGVILSADAVGGNGGLGGDAEGGNAIITGSGVNVDVTGDSLLSATATGGEDSGSSGAAVSGGGNAQGGQAEIQIVSGGAFTQTGGDAVLDTTGIGGDSFDGPGGNGTGGDATLEVLGAGSIDFAQDVTLHSDGVGGISTGGFVGGDGNGNIALIVADGGDTGLAIGGDLLVTANGTGGGDDDTFGGVIEFLISDTANLFIGGNTMLDAIASGGTGTGVLRGGRATGGEITISIDNAAIDFGGFLSGDLEGNGGNGGDFGGDGQGGTFALNLANGTLHIGDFLGIEAIGFGGNAATGGQGDGGSVTMTVSDSTANFAGEIVFASDGRGGSSGTGNAPFIGGSGTGGTSQITITNSDFLVDLVNGRVILSSEGQGVGSANGTGGDGTGGLAQLDVNGSTATLGNELNLFTLAVSGGSNTAGGGTARGGDNIVNLLGSDVTVGRIILENTATGNGAPPGGDAFGGMQTIALDNSTLTAGDLAIFGEVITRSDGATAQGSFNSISLTNGSTASFADGYIEAAAFSNGAASDNEAGAISIRTGGGADSTLTFNDLELFLDSANGTTNRAGMFDIVAGNGTIAVNSLTISAVADLASLDPSSITADAGNILIESLLDVAVTGDLFINYGNGGTIIGGAADNDLSATFDLMVDGTLEIDGDDAGRDGLQALDGTFASRDIAIGSGAGLFVSDLTLQSLNTDAQAMIGGTTAGSGYSLLSDEVIHLRADNLAINLPQQTASGPDVLIDDIAFTGSAGGNLSSLSIDSNGSMEIIGDLSLSDVGSSDSLSLFANTYISLIVPDASVTVNAGSSALGGTLLIQANEQVIATTSATRDLILSDQGSPAIGDALIDSTGFDGEVFISANRVEIFGDGGIFTQNTGQNDIFAGILVGPGGLLLSANSENVSLIPVIAFGAQTDDGPLITNDDFFALADFAIDRAGTYTADATLNNCIIVSSSCPTIVDPGSPIDPEEPELPEQPEEPDFDEPIFNKVLLEEPLIPPEYIPQDPASDAFFGADFPALFDAPLIHDDGVVRDPVTSGGDSALYTLGAGDTDDEDQEEEDN